MAASAADGAHRDAGAIAARSAAESTADCGAPASAVAAPRFYFLVTLAMTAVGRRTQMYLVLSVSTLTILKCDVLVLFVILFAWIAFSWPVR